MGKRRQLRRQDGKPIDHSKMSAGFASKQTGKRGGFHAELRWQDYYDKSPGKVKTIPITKDLADKYTNTKEKE